MEISTKIFVLSTMFALFSVHSYVTSIHAPAVLITQNTGALTLISLNITPGSGHVTVSGPYSVGQSTQQSAMSAVTYAAAYTGINSSNYNFSYYINDPNVSVSGPSAGLAFTLLAISGIEHKQLYNDFTVTGTINSNGDIGEIGGVYDKMQAAKASGMKYALVPAVPPGSFYNLLYFITQTQSGMPMVEISNVSQALKYAYANGNPILPLQYNISSSYNLDNLPYANITCTICNVSYFGTLTNYTINQTALEINSISSAYGVTKAQMLQQLSKYAEMAQKGYLYVGADLAFLQYQNAFVLANTKYYNLGSTKALLDNISTYCSSLTPPQMTNNNYEYVIGGQLRQEWGLYNIQSDIQALNTPNITTDQILNGLSVASASQEWCGAANEMYSIASQMGGQDIQLSPQVKYAALNYINIAKNYGNNIYLSTAMESYNDSNYGTALYGSIYAAVLNNPDLMSNYTVGEIENMTISNAKNSTFGVWPSQFGNEAMFYVYESSLRPNDLSNLSSGYTVSVLAKNLNNANKLILNSSIISQSNSTLNVTREITGIQTSISQIYYVLLVISIVIIAILVTLIAILIKIGKKPQRRR
ncbi:MAG: hypothetical protein M1122_02645 [Candidatus Marsarchaeota archaeon]|nr:hypothetical protein [Candidatus Marsarchaeota archaeon]